VSAPTAFVGWDNGVRNGELRRGASLPVRIPRRHGYYLAPLRTAAKAKLVPCKTRRPTRERKAVNGSDWCKEEVMAQDRSSWSEQDVVELKEMAGKLPLKDLAKRLNRTQSATGSP
jgi:hypothetical protein